MGLGLFIGLIPNPLRRLSIADLHYHLGRYVHLLPRIRLFSISQGMNRHTLEINLNTTTVLQKGLLPLILPGLLLRPLAPMLLLIEIFLL
jgi:hypothetical protein